MMRFQSLLSLKGKIIIPKSLDLTLSLEYYEKSLEIIERIGYKDILPNVLNGIGTVYFQIENYRKALEYFQKVLIRAKEKMKGGVYILKKSGRAILVKIEVFV